MKELENNEILAVISAAITSMNMNKNGCKLVVKSLRKVTQSSPVWNIAGRLERLDVRLN